ncbi:MAG TPA: hypothetical protein VGK40_07650 [Verrucomicrobiae bacterium]|jgi:hypothetical protein
MNAENELLKLYRQWAALSEAEFEAIRNRAWLRLDECQEKKKLLQVEIERATGAARQELQMAGLAPDVIARRFQPVVEQLISLELKNTKALNVRQHEAGQQQLELQQASLHLRQIHRAYVPGPAPGWNSYS